jgi:crotonobetainyl-CoA:carnitine CoA-transferase CaiB-like acyl-CoA transferase
VVQLLVDPDDC